MNEKPANEEPANEKFAPEGPVPMDCAAFEKISQHLYSADAAEAEAALAHAESCSRCAALLTEVEWLEFSMRDLARHDAARRVSPRVESALLQEFRRQKAADARRQIRWRLAALGAAAVLFLALGFSLRKHGIVLPHSSSAPEPSAAASHVQPAVAPALLPAPAQTPVHAKVTNTAVAPARRQSASSDSSDSEDAGAFVPLPYADDSAAVDGGAIVRVVLSRSALASFGVPVDDFASTDPIQADLVVGVDGTPEAIRLVSQLNPNDEF
jgi:hypothetical protein